MPRDISTETAILEILARLFPTPLKESTLAREVDIAADRCLTRDEFQSVITTLSDRNCIHRGINRQGLPSCWITETGRAVLNG